MRYRRDMSEGQTFFFTSVCAGRRPVFHDPAQIGLLRDVIREVREERPFELVAMVVMPDHLHALWSLPPGDAAYSSRWQAIKSRFSRRCGLPPAEATAQTARGGRGIWQNRFWEHRIRDQEDWNRHLDYIHWNPVSHGHVAHPRDWPWSSFMKFVKAGIYPVDWIPDQPPRPWQGEP